MTQTSTLHVRMLGMTGALALLVSLGAAFAAPSTGATEPGACAVAPRLVEAWTDSGAELPACVTAQQRRANR